MPGSKYRRLALLRARLANEADALPGDFVRHLAGGPIGIVEHVKGEWATVFWHNRPEHREIIEIKWLKQASADPAFGPDVRPL